VHISVAAMGTNLWSYAKSITFAWQNGFAHRAQGILGIFLSAFAALALIHRERLHASTETCYLLVYLGILTVWGTQIGIRGLLPILPIYLTYVLLGISHASAQMTRPAARAFLAMTAICITLTYIGALLHHPQQTPVANVEDPSARELFTFLRTQTASSDLLVFSKPRTLSLFTGNPATSLGPDEDPVHAAQFLRRTHVRFLIQSSWNPPPYHNLIAQQRASLNEVFRNHDFQVFQVQSEDNGQNENLASR
jgi:hypothetical protein